MKFLILQFFIITKIFGCPEKTLRENEAYRTPEEIATDDGYGEQFESHTVVTADGYILTLHRIRPSKCCTCVKGVIILQHGLFFGSTQWFLLGKDISLAYLLVDRCYDVWLINSRGTCYSRKHRTLCEDDKQFWDFSWHEIGYYDIPASVDYVASYTGRSDLILLAYSQGTTTVLVAASLHPELKHKIKAIILLTPVAYTFGSPYCVAATVEPLATASARNGGYFEVCTNKKSKNEMKEKFCADDKFKPFCSTMFASCGYDPRPVEPELVPILNAQVCGASFKQLLHFAQGCLYNSFAWYKDSPISITRNYDLRKITIPVYMWYAINDNCAIVADVKRIESELGNLVNSCKIDDILFTHTDVYARPRAKLILYDKIIPVIEGLFANYCCSFLSV